MTSLPRDADLPPDWADDFDLSDVRYVTEPERVWSAMRSGCPVAASPRNGGEWIVARHKDIAAIALDQATYSSRAGQLTGPVPAPGTELKLPPVTSDPPHHSEQRRLLLPLFSRPAVSRLEPIARSTASTLLDRITSQRQVDAALEYAQPIPVVVTVRMLGLPVEDEGTFQAWTTQMLKEGANDQAVRADAVRKLKGHFDRLIAGREIDDPDGVVAFLLTKQADYPWLSDDTISGMCFLMLIAGIDTTWSVLGSALWHLAVFPDARRKLVEEPDRIPAAVEEFLRVYAPVTIARIVTTDTTLGERSLKAGERVILPWAAANHDPNLIEEPESFDVCRSENRHVAFGIGAHRCLGAQLARMELQVGLEEWLRRLPDFDLAADSGIRWTTGNTRGPMTLPLRLG
jgi:cytochrome P450